MGFNYSFARRIISNSWWIYSLKIECGFIIFSACCVSNLLWLVYVGFWLTFFILGKLLKIVFQSYYINYMQHKIKLITQCCRYNYYILSYRIIIYMNHMFIIFYKTESCLQSELVFINENTQIVVRRLSHTKEVNCKLGSCYVFCAVNSFNFTRIYHNYNYLYVDFAIRL